MTATYVHCRCCGNILSTGAIETFEHNDPEEFADREIIDPRTGEPRIVQVVTKYVKRTKAQPSGFTFEGVICQPTKDGPVSFCVGCYGEHEIHKKFKNDDDCKNVGNEALPPEAEKETLGKFKERHTKALVEAMRKQGAGKGALLEASRIVKAKLVNAGVEKP